MSNIRELIVDELLLLRVEAISDDDVLKIASQKMIKERFVKRSFQQALLDRERQFPTGLKTRHHGIAIPHADAAHVIKEGISLMTLSSPVTFKRMDNKKETVDVEFVFVLALKDASKHLDVLRQLTNLLQNAYQLTKIKTAKTAKEILNAISQ